MKIYTHHNGKHLWLVVPPDWTADDVQFFVGQNKRLKVEDLKVEELDKETPTIQSPYPESKKMRVPTTKATKAPAPIVLPVVAPVVDHRPTAPALGPTVASVPNIERSKASRCADHPSYTGMRLGAKVNSCPACMALYQAQRAAGAKESRTHSK